MADLDGFEVNGLVDHLVVVGVVLLRRQLDKHLRQNPPAANGTQEGS